MNRNSDVEGTNENLGSREKIVPPVVKRIRVNDGFSEQAESRAEVVPINNDRVEINPRSEITDVAQEKSVIENTMHETVEEPTSRTEVLVSEEARVPSDERHISTSSGQISAPQRKQKRRKAPFIALGIILLFLLGAATWWLLAGNKQVDSVQNDDMSSAPITKSKIRVVITVADGKVEFKRDEAEWKVANTTTQMQEGDYVRTGVDSRAVLTLDDGSAVRVDANTIVVLENLSADEIIIRQEEGIVYSRVVPSDRKYVVAIGETAYQALGTAFVTVKNQNETGVQVYQSSVKVDDSSDVVTEGSQYYDTNSDPTLEGKVTTISIDKLVYDSFVTWNLSQDENDIKFKTKLGVLTKIKQRSEELEKERQAEEVRKGLAEKSALEKGEADEKKRSETTGDMVLSLAGKTFSWRYTGKAIHGYKLVYSKSSETPTFGVDDSMHFDINETSGSITDKDNISSGDYYNVRVCAYSDETEAEPCVDYSNIVVLRL